MSFCVCQFHSNKHALTIGGATIDDLIDDDDRGGNFHMKQFVLIKSK